MNDSRSADRDLQELELRAYLLWERAGRPEGRDKEFWAQAEQDTDATGTENRAAWERLPHPFATRGERSP